MIFIVGATGLIGKRLYDLCKEQNLNVLGTSTTGQQDGIEKYCIGDDDPERLLKYFEPEKKQENVAVITGAITNLNECYKNRALSEKVNVVGTKLLIEKLHQAGIKIVFLSSDCVFDGKEGHYTEESPTNPVCVYGEQKEAIEKYILENISDGLIYRISKQYDLSCEGKHLFADLYNGAKKGKIRCIEGLVFNPTYVGDTAECILSGIDRGLIGLYNVAAPESYSRYNLAKEMAKALNVDETTEITCEPLNSFSFPEDRPLNLSLDTSKIESVIEIEFKKALSMIETYVDNI
ncbi:sugar nucleotide-binding protein [Butyrivibrio sp. INlla16]|uniref:SDR family oxidoreductase n=1 Tax=Butyrivibrio sp. INlla16 TaxID=1520807 RepID=UPI00088A4554|nr:sugar nucleotide-binding protein [Butyrivibrio sp. INlla16]SDB60133.1 dTDP-4-dehydrorhamnose reductase [Butyrivibrio sp. INlla16]